MNEYLSDLIEAYIKHLELVTLYNQLNDYIKDKVKLNGNRMVLNRYLLNVKKVDKSEYDKKLIDYLQDKSYNAFLLKEVDNLKIKNAVKNGCLNREYLIENIKKDKTVLDIVLPDINIKKSDLDIKNLSLVKKVDKRMELKNDIVVAKSIYFEKAKFMKDVMKVNDEKEYRFKSTHGIGLIRLRTVNREYNEEFINECEINEIDVFKSIINNKKLRDSKLKKIVNDEYIQSCKIESYQEYLSIKKV